MEDHEIPTQPVSEWQPITNKLDLAVLGKFGEELCEAGAAVFRCIIQGVDECEPTTGKPNKAWLEDEVADVLAMIQFVRDHFALDRDRVNNRIVRKRAYKRPWFESLKKGENP